MIKTWQERIKTPKQLGTAQSMIQDAMQAEIDALRKELEHAGTVTNVPPTLKMKPTEQCPRCGYIQIIGSQS